MDRNDRILENDASKENVGRRKFFSVKKRRLLIEDTKKGILTANGGMSLICNGTKSEEDGKDPLFSQVLRYSSKLQILN